MRRTVIVILLSGLIAAMSHAETFINPYTGRQEAEFVPGRTTITPTDNTT